MQTISEKILKSKKYKALYPKTVEYIISKLSASYSGNILEDKVRNLLHQIWGAYYSYRPNFTKLYNKIEKLEINDSTKSNKSIVEDILRMHASTSERLDYYTEFYKEIFKITGYPEIINDIGCGLNPFSKIYLEKNISYKAFDIDCEEIAFINQISKKLNLNINAIEADFLVDSFPEADLTILLKVIPVFQKIAENKEVVARLDKLQTNYIVISYPTKSISGKDKGMATFYEESFYSLINMSLILRNSEITKIHFPNDLVFIIKK